MYNQMLTQHSKQNVYSSRGKHALLVNINCARPQSYSAYFFGTDWPRSIKATDTVTTGFFGQSIVISEQLRPLRPSGISKMPSYKLTYFDVRGRAESIRMLFAMAGAEYENCVVGQADWPEMKKSKFWPLPILQKDPRNLPNEDGDISNDKFPVTSDAMIVNKLPFNVKQRTSFWNKVLNY